MESETRPAADAVSQVLDNADLLIEILLRVGFPTTLVRAALVCKLWLGYVSDRAFLRRFRELHPPHLLGFYIRDRALPTVTPSFVPVLRQPPELATVIRRASFSLDTIGFVRTYIHDCRNSSLFCSMYGSTREGTCRVRNPLCPEKDLAIPPVPQHVDVGHYCMLSQVVSKEEEDGLSYFYLYGEFTICTAKPEFRVHVYMLHDGFWSPRHLFNIDRFLHPRTEPKAMFIGNKIYMAAELGDIIVLDLTTSRFYTIQLPRGVDHFGLGTTILSRAHNAPGVYVIHANKFQLHIWLHKADSWLLVDTICLRGMCANLQKSGCTIGKVLLMGQVVDYGDFVFLDMGGWALQLDIKCRTLRKVYETKAGHLGDIYPFMMIWPPKFRVLRYDPARLPFG